MVTRCLKQYMGGMLGANFLQSMAAIRNKGKHIALIVEMGGIGLAGGGSLEMESYR